MWVVDSTLFGYSIEQLVMLSNLVNRPSPEEILKAVQAEFGDNEKLARRASIHLCHKHSGLKLGEVGESFNVRDTAISEASRRFVRELKSDEKLREVVERVKGRLKICGM